MRRALVLIGVAVLVAASQACAGGLDLSWNDCLGGLNPATNRNFLCTSPTQSYTLIFQFKVPANINNFAVITAYVDLESEALGPLAPFWHHEPGGCNSPGGGPYGISVSSDMSQLPLACQTVSDPWDTGGSAFYSYQPNYPCQGRARLTIICSRSDPVLLGIGFNYYAFHLKFSTANRAICPGCSDPINIVWSEAILTSTDGSPAVHLTGPDKFGDRVTINELNCVRSISALWPCGSATGSPVTIHGSCFNGATSVRFNGTPAAFTVANDNRIDATVPAGATTGPIEVTTPYMQVTSDAAFVPGWLTDSPIAAMPAHQGLPVSVPDASGGAIVAWEDERACGGGTDIYAQGIGGSGIAPGWPCGGLPVCTASGQQHQVRMAADGAGGAFIAWHDERNGSTNTDIYVHRVTGTGVFSAGWPVDGVALCNHPSAQFDPVVISDGAGGAIVAWADVRISGHDIFAQRVNSSGVPQWTPNGVAVCSVAGNQERPRIAPDGSGGAIVVWEDTRNGALDLYAERVNAAGVRQWGGGPAGVPLCTASGHQSSASLIPDGAGGAIVCWDDSRSGTSYDVYVDHLGSGGTSQWVLDGVPLVAVPEHQTGNAITTDGAGGAIVTWHDGRGGAFDIFAQRVDASGAPLWSTNGVGVTNLVANEYAPAIASDGSGGAIISWQDERAGNRDIYAQRVDGSGAPLWTGNGVALSTATGAQQAPAIVPAFQGGAIVAWEDQRSANSNVYATPVNHLGTVDVDLPSGNASPPFRAWPNPATGQIRIAFTLTAASLVSVEVFDLSGRRVRILQPSWFDAGEQTLAWDGRGDGGTAKRNGVYFVRVRGDGFESSGRVVLAR